MGIVLEGGPGTADLLRVALTFAALSLSADSSCGRDVLRSRRMPIYLCDTG